MRAAWACGSTFSDADVVEQIPADDRRRNPLAVLELDEDTFARRDAAVGAASATFVITCAFVRIAPVGVDDEPRALRAAVGAEIGVDRHDARRAAGVDRGGIEAVPELGERRRAGRSGRGGLVCAETTTVVVPLVAVTEDA